MSQIVDQIKQKAGSIGFDLVGIAPALSPATLPKFYDWLDAGFAGEMGYLERRRDAYADPQAVLQTVRSVIMLGVCYTAERPKTEEHPPSMGQIARYASGVADYHDVLRRLLKELADFVHQQHPTCRTRGVVDTAPLLERDFARRAGLGWFGKNTMLLNKTKGSYFFLAALLTDLDLPADAAHDASHCGTCTRCLEVCPTDALVEPYRLDARRCLAYLTIELRDQPIPHEFREPLQDWLFGCDLCQEVCPWNRHAPASQVPEFLPIGTPAQAAEFLTVSETEFRQKFAKTPLARPGRAGMARNAAIVLGNTGSLAHLPLLIDSLTDPSALVRGAAVWAIGQIAGCDAASILQAELATESDADVLQEIDDVSKKTATRNC